jgi:hypothetical protein
VKEKGGERSDTAIDQRVKDHLVNLKFSKYFPGAATDKYKWITDQIRLKITIFFFL